MLVIRILFLALLSTTLLAHEVGEAPHCAASENPQQIQAPYLPGTLTVDGQDADWAAIDGQEFALQAALHPESAQPYPYGSGSMQVKAAHDGRDIFFLLKVPGPYVFDATNHHLSASAALMFAVGDDATHYNMGGCPIPAGSCNRDSCRGHEVDFVHFEISSAVPGRLYGSSLVDQLDGSGKDRIGSLNDGYAWNAHCRQVDGLSSQPGPGLSLNGSSKNDWQGVWSHSAINLDYGLISEDQPYAAAGTDGYFTFEFTRPLRTLDHFQQDAEFSIGSTARMGVAFWYPVDSQPWDGAQHFVISCDWVPLDINPAGWAYTPTGQGLSNTAVAAISGLALLLSLAAVMVVIVVGWWVRANSRQFVSLEI